MPQCEEAAQIPTVVAGWINSFNVMKKEGNYIMISDELNLKLPSVNISSEIQTLPLSNKFISYVLNKHLFDGLSRTDIDASFYGTKKYNGMMSQLVVEYYGINNDKGIYNSHVYAYDDAGNGVLKALDSIPMASKIVTNLGDFTAKIVLKDNTNYAISAEGTNANANVSLAQKSSNDSGQIWQFRKKSDGKSYEIINVASGKLLDVFNAKDENKANVEIYPQNGNIAQTFYIMEYNGGYRIVA